MALQVAELVAKLVADTKDFVKGVDKAEKEAKKSFSSIEKGLDKVGDVGKKLTTRVSLPIIALGANAVRMANDVDESLNKVNVVFGKNGREIDEWSKGAAKNLGLSRGAALDAAGSFGNMFVQLGIGTKEAARMSTGITELAADFASFHNADISQVIEAQSAAFRGEYDSLQRFLPLINAATVEQKALAMTGKESNKELTAQEKALAVNALMFEGAGKAMGDFERTSDGATNKQRILKAELANTSAELGEKLQPAFNKLLSVLVNTVIPAFEKLGGDNGVVILAAAAMTGPLLVAIEKVGTALTFLAAHPMVAVIASMILFSVWLQKTDGNAQSLRDGIGHAFEAIANTVMSAVGFVVQAMSKLLGVWATTFEVASHIPGIGDKFAGIADRIRMAQDTGERWASTLHRGIDQLTSDAERLGFELQSVARDTGNLLAGAQRIGSVDPRQNRNVVGPVPRFHQGGVVPGPRGSEVPAVLQAGEMVLPAGASMGGGTVINITVSGDTDPDGAARRIHEMLRSYQRRSGPLGLN